TLNRPTSTHIYDKNDIITEPVSNSVLIKQIKICNNLKIPEKVLELEQEKILTKDALLELQNNNFSNYYLIKLFSFGILGINKKIVPTRWSITAVDDILSKNLLETIVDKQSINKIYIFENYLLHNKFIIILLPGNYEYELYEINLKEIIINQMKEYIIDSFTYDHEFVTGKKEYSIQAGGYYAVRLAVCEYLSRINKQAKVIAIRFIYPEYRKSLGVWNVRENVRDAMKNKKYEFSSQDELLLYLKNVFGKDYLKLIKKSIILNQTRLFDH
ncbi:MAG: hypothetical protein N3E37_04030, partial [Candidatus Micrarchaeota archaeon]|nr:hypothetical protein [Candidatus Micrarchaeota archaeon]